MKRFAQLYEQLDATTKTTAKVEALVHYFNEADPNDAIWCVALLMGKRMRRPVKTSLMKEWVAELAAIPQWLVEESHHIVGDLGESLSLLTPEAKSHNAKPLHVLMKELSHLSQLDEQQKKEFVLNAWSELSGTERYLFNKLIGGSFRVGVSQQLVIKALAKVTERKQEEIALSLMGNWQPEGATLDQLLSHSNTHYETSRPYPFYLAYGLEVEPQELGGVEHWQMEYKWDGIRGQLVMRDGQLNVWTRGEELVTEKFPEFAGLEKLARTNVVLDGEILCHNGERPLPFGALQTRITRKSPTKKYLAEAPVRFMAYDVLEFEGRDVRHLPLIERRFMLESVVRGMSHPSILLSPVVEVSSWQEAIHKRAESRQMQSEGLMLKHKESSYEVGRKKGNWWKWKVDAMTIDAVMIYAMQGHGRRANLYTDYTFAVWDGAQLVPFTKAYSGLTDKEILEVDKFIRKNTIEKFGPVRSVTPSLVFEIAFEGIQKSPRHKSGIALRFPRIHKWRVDKKADEANTLDDLKTLLEQFG